MNLAIRDIRHDLARFFFTAVGVGMLLMIVMGMGGIYRGIVDDALLLANRIGADLWVVQQHTRGPFAEISRVPLNLEDRLRAVPGVLDARAFVSHTIQREHRGQPLRMVVQGLSWPGDKGRWLPLVVGRSLEAAHYEMVADALLGLELGECIPLGRDVYTVVGITRGMVGQSGDGMAFFTVRDALAIQFDNAPESVRLERAARKARSGRLDISQTQPFLTERLSGPSSALPAAARPLASAVLVQLAPGQNVKSVSDIVSGWTDVSVYSRDEQQELLMKTVDRPRRQLGLFRVLLVVVSAIVMALILYTLTLDKVHDIAMLKLMGARNRVIVGLILQQAILLGFLGYVFAFLAKDWVFPLFPRRVIITPEDLFLLAVVVLIISVLASLLGIWKAMRVQPNEVVS
ncbi:MAG: ABC transporter permease [Thermodesulfobacteriota bacterium]